MMDPEKATRVLSAMTKTDCILLTMNKEVFNMMVKEQIKKEREEKGKFVYNSIPKLKENVSLFSVTYNANIIFKETNVY